MPKSPNYTPEMTAVMYTMYDAVREDTQEVRDSVIGEIANTLQADFEAVRKPKSIMSKLSRMLRPDGTKLYVSKVKVSEVTGIPAAKKDAMAAPIAIAINAALPEKVGEIKIPRISADNLVKLNKSDLQALDAYVTMNTVADEPEAETEEETETEEENES